MAPRAHQERDGRGPKPRGTPEEIADASAALRYIGKRVAMLAEVHGQAVVEREQAIREAIAVGMSYREIGALIGVSHSRVEQILRAGPVPVDQKVRTLSTNRKRPA